MVDDRKAGPSDAGSWLADPGPQPDSRRSWSRAAIVAALLVVVTLLHWATPVGGGHLHVLHIALRKLFILPVVLGAIWFGLPGGLLTATVAAAAYLPFVSVRWAGYSAENLNQLGELFSLWAIGLVVGWLAGRETRRLAEVADAARLERRRLEGVVDSAGVGMMLVDPDLRLRWYSRRVAGWLRGLPLALDATCPLLDGESGCETCVVRAALESGEAVSAERKGLGPGGNERFFRHTATPVADRDGALVQAVEVIEDITDRRALEMETIRTEKLSVLGRMAAGVAHEIGNPLSSISTRLRLLERKRDQDFVAQSVEVLQQQIERISRIVQGVSQFGRNSRAERAVFALNELVEEMIGVVELDRRAGGVRFASELAKPSPRVFGVRDQIGQILLNLLLNAVEASPEGGTVLVRTGEAEGAVRLAVDDEGTGIDPASREQLFEPFYTTRSRGTGLGLAISHGFATAHGGRIDVEESAAGGASLVLVLPEGRPGTGRAHGGKP